MSIMAKGFPTLLTTSFDSQVEVTNMRYGEQQFILDTAMFTLGIKVQASARHCTL